MRKSKVLLLVPLMLLFCVGVAQAAFDNSHHDMTTYVSGEGRSCFHCHGRSSTVNTAGLTNQLGRVGGLCLSRCHQNATGIILTPNANLLPTAGANIDTAGGAYTPTVGGANNANYTVVYFTNSHNRYKAGLRNAAGGTQNLAATPAANWPYVSAADNAIECTSCHAVHDSANAPFLWAPLAASSATALDGFCDRCHTERATNNLTVTAPDGNHPVDFAVDNTATGSAGRANSGRHGRAINIQGYGASRAFDVPNPAAAVMTGTANSWAMGGHLTSGPNAAMTTWTSGASTQQMGCYTCHAAHRTSVTGENQLTVVANVDASLSFNALCVGCHGLSTTWAADSNEYRVGTSAWGHPVGANTSASGGLYTASAGGFTFQVATPTWIHTPAGHNQNNQYGTAGRVLCTSCHKVHFGTGMSLANINQGTRAICKSCHTGTGIVNVADMSKGGAASATNHNAPNSHHVTRSGNSAGNIGKTGDPGIVLVITQPSWRNATTGLGDLSTGMDCADCHVFNGTAHNW